MRPRNLIATLLFVAVIITLFLQNPRSNRVLQLNLLNLISPFVRSGSSLEAKHLELKREILLSRDLERENRELRGEISRLRLRARHMDKMEEELRSLRRALDFKEKSPFELLAAEIVMRNPSTWWNTVVINKGYADGVDIGAPVLSDKGLVGKVISCTDDLSVVVLMTDQRCKVTARIDGTRYTGIITGSLLREEEKPYFSLKYLPKSSRVEIGQKVVSEGVATFPMNLPLGVVRKVEKKDISSEALVEPYIDFNDLEVVFVIGKQDSENGSISSGN